MSERLVRVCDKCGHILEGKEEKKFNAEFYPAGNRLGNGHVKIDLCFECYRKVMKFINTDYIEEEETVSEEKEVKEEIQNDSNPGVVREDGYHYSEELKEQFFDAYRHGASGKVLMKKFGLNKTQVVYLRTTARKMGYDSKDFVNTGAEVETNTSTEKVTVDENYFVV